MDVQPENRIPPAAADRRPRQNNNQCKKTYQFITQFKGVICHPFKTAKINVFDPMKYKSPNVPLQDELPC